LLQHETFNNEFILFTRWGRVGVQGQNSESGFKSRDLAVREYNKKLNEKKKTYKEVEMNYEENVQPEKKEDKPKKEGPASTLLPQVQDLIRLIFDMKMMAKQMKEIGYDANKMPLGKLAKSSILKGYTILQEIMNELKGKNRTDVVNRLSGDFFSEIPHNFGFRKMHEFVLKTEQKVKEKLEMLQSLEDIQVFTKLLDDGAEDGDVNQLDSNYLKLNTAISPLDKASPTY
jgi:poly [ADP-ribose] polymerase